MMDDAAVAPAGLPTAGRTALVSEGTPSVGSRMISGGRWLAASRAAAQVITWGTTVFVVRLLSPDDYGLMGMAVLFMGFLFLFNEIGLGTAIIQKPEISDRQLSNLRWAILFVNLVLFLALLGIAPAIAAYFREPRLTAVIRVLGLAFIINGIGTPSMCMLSRTLAFKRKSQAEFIASVAGGAATLACAAAGLGVWSLISGYLLLHLVRNALYCAFWPPEIIGVFSLTSIRQYLNFGFQVTIGRVLWYISSNADFTVVGRVLGTTQLGFYSLAFQFSSLPIEKLVSIMTELAYASFSSLQNDDRTLGRYYLKLVGMIGLITFPMFLGLLLVAESAVGLFLTPAWTPVILPLKILCVASCLRAVDTMNAPVLLAKGHSGMLAFNNLLQVLVMPLAFYFGARHGITGVSMAWLIAWPLVYLFMTTRTLRLVGLTFEAYVGALKHSVVGSVLMVLLVLLVQSTILANASSASRFAATLVLGSGAYLSYMALFNVTALRDALRLVRRT